MRHRASAHPPDGPGRARLGARLAAVAGVGVMLASAVALLAALSGLPERAPAGAAVAADAPRGSSVPSEPARDIRPAPAEATRRLVPATEHWRTVLASLDRRRARAYAAADPALLRAVYVPGSAALRRDQRLLGRYARRGLHISGLRMHVADLGVRAQRPGRVVLRVRDRVGGGTVTGGGHRRPLPVDDVDTRLLTLRRVDRGGWLLAAVRPVS